jgi:hypothetical protein
LDIPLRALGNRYDDYPTLKCIFEDLGKIGPFWGISSAERFQNDP